MNDTATATEEPASKSTGEAAFATIEGALRAEGPSAALDRLTEHLAAAGEYRALLDALLLKARHELNLPPITSGSLSDLPEPRRGQYEEKYVAAIRLVGSKYLEAGDIPTAWAYYRAITETEPVAQAILHYRPAENDERLGAIIEVAFNHGVSPERGFELILDHYGTCPAISAFEQLPPQEHATRTACAARLIRHLHRDLCATLRSEIASRGQVVPPVGSPIAELLRGRPWIFADESYHIDISHLAAVVRMSLLAQDREVIALAADLTEYGRRLSPRLLFEGPPPFEQIFDDHGIYLHGLLGHEVDQAITHFQGKITAENNAGNDASLPAQTLVNLLAHVGQIDAAIDVAAQHLANVPESALACPSIAQLCERAGQPDRLARIARDQGDLVTFTAALLEAGARPVGTAQRLP
jgi:hypothetical protein